MSEEFKNNNNQVNTVEDFFNPLVDAFISMPMESRKVNRLMKTDIEEKDDDYVVKVDMPGINKDSIKVSVKNGYLNVGYKQETTSENKDIKHHYLRKERYFGEMERSFYLGEVDASKVDASYENGVLNIIVPKVKEKDDNTYISVK